MAVNFSWLDDFLVLAAVGNFSRAASERNMTQPAFSRRIRALEDWLGTDLFDRRRQPVRLTTAGEWFRTVAQELQARVARVPAEARAVAEASAATLRFAATHALSFSFMPGWLRSLEALTALGPVTLNSDVLQRCETALLESRVEFVLAHAHPLAQGVLDEAGYPSVAIGRERLIPVSLPDAQGQPLFSLSAAASGGAPILAYSPESGLHRILQAVLGSRLDQLAPRLVFTAHLASVLRTMALDGRGLAWLPGTLVGEDLAAGRLTLAAAADWGVPLEIRLYRERAAIGAAAEAFWRAVQALPATVSAQQD